MGQWGVRSYEGDEAADAIDAGFDRVHGAEYEALMDDGNPLTYEQVQEKLAGPATLAAALAALAESCEGRGQDSWDDAERLAYAGVVVRHAELGVPIPPADRDLALSWLESEDIEWEQATARRLRRQKEIALLRQVRTAEE